MKPNKFHSTCECFGGRKTREEPIWLTVKFTLFGFPNVLVSRSALTVAYAKQVVGFILNSDWSIWTKSCADNMTLVSPCVSARPVRVEDETRCLTFALDNGRWRRPAHKQIGKAESNSRPNFSVTVNCFPFDVIVFAILPARGIGL